MKKINKNLNKPRTQNSYSGDSVFLPRIKNALIISPALNSILARIKPLVNSVRGKIIARWASILAISLVISLSLSYAWAAWKDPGPGATPPNNNEPAFLNIGTASQLKSGGLEIEGLFTTDNATNLATSTGNVGIGTTTPPEKLTLEGGNFLQTASNPKHIGSVGSMPGGRDIFVSGKYAYFAYFYGIGIIDVSNPSNPIIVSILEDDVNRKIKGAKAIKVAGKYAYIVSSLENSFTIIDISNPFSPFQVGFLEDNANTLLLNPLDLYVSGKYAYVVSYDENGLEVIDISNPTNPQHVGYIQDDGNTLLQGAKSVFVSSRYAYVTSDTENGVEIIDISNPALPLHIGKIQDNSNTLLSWANDIYVSGRYAYITSYTEKGVEVIDVRDPANPYHAGSFQDDGSNQIKLSSPNGVFISGKYAYVADWSEDGLEILDISGIDAPTASIGNISASQISVTENMDIGNNLYIRNGLNIGSGGIKSDGVIQATSTEAFKIKLPLSSPGTCGSFYVPAGSIYFNTTLNEPCYCNGSGGWTQFDGGGGC